MTIVVQCRCEALEREVETLRRRVAELLAVNAHEHHECEILAAALAQLRRDVPGWLRSRAEDHEFPVSILPPKSLEELIDT